MSDGDAGDTNWREVFRAMFKRVTEEEIEAYKSQFVGSEKQVEDVRAAYVKYEGDLNLIIETVIGFDAENEDELRDIIWSLINSGEVEAYVKFVDEPEKARKRRWAKREREMVEAKKLSKKLKKEGGWRRNSQRTARAFLAGTDDLFTAIRDRQEQRHKNLTASLEAKYGGHSAARR